MTRRYHEHCPEILKPHTKYSSRRELSFDVLDSSYVVATAGGIVSDEVRRSPYTASELAFWPKSTAAEIYNGLMQAVPNTKGHCLHRKHRQRCNGRFLRSVERRRGRHERIRPSIYSMVRRPRVSGACAANFEPTPDEEDLIEKYGLDNEQLMFRRRKVAQNGIDLWNQEYPAEPEQAFLTTGRPVFNPEQLQQCLERTRPRRTPGT